MSTFFIFLLLLICILLSLLNYKKTSLIIGSVVIVSYLVIGDGFFPAYLLHNLQSPYSQSKPINWEKTNTIILLGAGTSKDPSSNRIKPSILAFSRIAQTAIIYHECKKANALCHILISGGDPLNNGKSEAKTYQESLLSLGINSNDIQLETQSKNTYQNAKFSSSLLKKQYSKQLLLVNSGLTLKRALLYFSFFNLYPKPIAADFITIPISKFPLGYNFAMNDFAIHEYIGILRFYIYNFLGWNKK
ncbi:YdcF family protein [Rickettsiella endosymbiont of Miltochrista miniata]|uniref:YdcF family protein n=1 Tax=Rickettsiella endosymbiont of Miltochrista miniata TaxID=3066239 RepID=UPI00313D466A